MRVIRDLRSILLDRARGQDVDTSDSNKLHRLGPRSVSRATDDLKVLLVGDSVKS